MFMKINNVLSLLLLSLLGLFVQSCNDKDDNQTASRMEITQNGKPVSTIQFSLSKGSAIIGVATDGDWTVSSDDESWCTLDVHAGYGYADSLKTSYTRVNVTKNEGEARTANLTFKSGSLTNVVTITQRGKGTDPGDTFPSSFATLENFVLGYNLGNTLDSNPSGSWWNPEGKTPIDYETQWGQPETTQEIIDAIASKGFNVIRVPVTWKPHMDASGNVDAAWMARVKEVVDMVLKANCYCILNVQHDTGADASAWVQANMDSYNANGETFKKLWTQIANTFKSYGDHLLFEAFNEILYTNTNDGWTAPAAGTDYYEAIRKYHQAFVDAVRATGGNNEYRNLVINPYSASSSQTVLNELVVPADVHSNHIMMSVHSYDPYNFCNDNGEWSILVFDDACREEIDGVFDRVMSRASELGIPAFFGEFGAIDGKKDPAERIKYARYMAQKFKANNTIGLWWMGLIDRKKLEWTESEIVDALFQNIQ